MPAFNFFLPSARMPRVIHRDFMVIDGVFMVIVMGLNGDFMAFGGSIAMEHGFTF